MTKAQREARIAQIVEEIGSLSKTSKMPCRSWGISARDCITGARLVELEGSVCSKCYALKGMYFFKDTKSAHAKRKDSMLNNPNWVPLMSELIELSEDSGYFRWFDSGDVQSLKNLEDIVQIANNLPKIQFWLPTKEWGIVLEYKEKHGAFPTNLIVRLSAYMVNSVVSEHTTQKLECVSSSVVTKEEDATCRAFEKGGKCHDCRACWKKEVGNVSYLKH